MTNEGYHQLLETGLVVVCSPWHLVRRDGLSIFNNSKSVKVGSIGFASYHWDLSIVDITISSIYDLVFTMTHSEYSYGGMSPTAVGDWKQP